jgi:hypothetical protein
MASRDDLVTMARGLGIQAESPPWALFGGAARGPYGLDAMLRIRSGRYRAWLIVSLAHSRPLNLGLHASPSSRPGACGAPELVGYADDREGAEALLATPAVRAAFAAFEVAEPADRFAVHVNDTVVWVPFDAVEEPTPGLLEAMHALSQALVSSARLPDSPPAPPFRRSIAARVLFIVLAPPALLAAGMAFLTDVEPWAAYPLIVLGSGGIVWILRRHLRRGRRR